MRTLKRINRPISEINIVPYVDVMLVLLVIFMATAPLLTQGVEIDLPSADAEALDVEVVEPIIVSIDENGLYYLNIIETSDEPIDIQSLQLRITSELSEDISRPVLVRGSQSVAYGQVMAAMVLLQEAGAPKVGLITQPPNESDL